MDILFLTTEFQGIVKTGGLADVAKALPKELALMGHNIKVVLPLYASAKNTDNLELILITLTETLFTMKILLHTQTMANVLLFLPFAQWKYVYIRVSDRT